MIDRELKVGDVLYDNRQPDRLYGPYTITTIDGDRLTYSDGRHDSMKNIIKLYDFHPLKEKESFYLIHN